MSIAEGRRSPGAAQRGYSFVEVVFVVAIVMGIALVLGAVLQTAQSASGYLDAVRRTAQSHQRVLDEVAFLVSANHTLFGDDEEGVGRGYLDALELGARPLLPGARLPVIETEDVLGPDAPGAPRTGNVLLFASEGMSASAVAEPSVAGVREIDVYRFVCVYPRETTQRLTGEDQVARDLVLWRSLAYPSYPQIMAVEDEAERQNLVRDLYGRYGYRHAWDPQAPVSEAFHELDRDGGVAVLPSVWFRIAEDPDQSPRGRLVHKQVQLARTRSDEVARRAVYTADEPDGWKPDGFEIKIAGAVAVRQVWLHLVVEGRSSTNAELAIQSGTVVLNVRDL